MIRGLIFDFDGLMLVSLADLPLEQLIERINA